MSKVKVKLNREGVRSLLKSEEMAVICIEHALNIIQQAGDGYNWNVYLGKNRVNCSIVATTEEAVQDNLKNNTLLKAVKK